MTIAGRSAPGQDESAGDPGSGLPPDPPLGYNAGMRDDLATLPARDTDAAESAIDAVIEGIVTPLLIVDAGHVRHANASARDLLGATIVGCDVRDAIDHPAARERLAGTEGDSAPVELVGLGFKDQRWEMRVTPGPDGQRVVHLIDQTGNYTAEKMRVDFVANASHELRTPLSAILGFVETLAEDESIELDDRQRFHRIMLDEARRMTRLVEDLISLSRIEAEKYQLPEDAVDLAQLIQEVQSELTAGPDPRGRDVAISVPPGVPSVVGDRAQLSQLLHNLVSNAMKYGRAGTPIALTLSVDPTGTVRVAIADEGEGIPDKHLPRLTQRFYRVDSSRSRSLGGTGLGLAIVKHIVERHRGRLDITSSVGQGTTVTVLLPPARHKSATSRTH